MKKMLIVLLALVVCISISVCAFADEVASPEDNPPVIVPPSPQTGISESIIPAIGIGIGALLILSGGVYVLIKAKAN